MDGGPALDMVCGSRFLTKEHGYPAPISRRTGIHIFAFLLSRIVGQRVSDPTSGFRLYNRRAIALFARDYPHDYPEVEAVLMVHHHRLRMREVPVRMLQRGGGVSSIRSGKSVYYMVKVLLAIFVGLARARPVPEPGEDGAGGRGARDLMELGSRSSRSSAAAALLLRRARAGAPAAVPRALRAAVAAQRARACSGSSIWKGVLEALADAGRHRLPAERAVLRRVRVRAAPAAALLARRLAPVRPDEGARPAAGARRAAAQRQRGSARARRRAKRRTSWRHPPSSSPWRNARVSGSSSP